VRVRSSSKLLAGTARRSMTRSTIPDDARLKPSVTIVLGGPSIMFVNVDMGLRNTSIPSTSTTQSPMCTWPERSAAPRSCNCRT